ncbi:jg10645 [Pararge aegeria aegeria]|uniref:Jg10645 protein n=1 Tax=Pararge aegeria aegeria TaxID=348720 RepID=A0A8S4RU80_9NEOP|nr:jg10645 [Pararge aegeria aegeria]
MLKPNVRSWENARKDDKEGYPVKENDSNNKVEYKNEKQYPNGTVIGKYTYKDKEGTPVHVKYFADDSSYGVELKSAKVFDLNSDNLLQYKLPKPNNMISTVDIFQPLQEMNTVNTILNKEFNKNKTYNAYEVPNYYTNKLNRYKESNKANDDYEIFLENDLKPTAKCNKEKVKVYLDKNKRKTRNAPNRYRPSDYCERF